MIWKAGSCDRLSLNSACGEQVLKRKRKRKKRKAHPQQTIKLHDVNHEHPLEPVTTEIVPPATFLSLHKRRMRFPSGSCFSSSSTFSYFPDSVRLHNQPLPREVRRGLLCRLLLVPSLPASLLLSLKLSLCLHGLLQYAPDFQPLSGRVAFPERLCFKNGSLLVLCVVLDSLLLLLLEWAVMRSLFAPWFAG